MDFESKLKELEEMCNSVSMGMNSMGINVNGEEPAHDMEDMETQSKNFGENLADYIQNSQRNQPKSSTEPKVEEVD